MAEQASSKPGSPDADRVLQRVVLPRDRDPIDVRPLYLDEPERFARDVSAFVNGEAVRAPAAPAR